MDTIPAELGTLILKHVSDMDSLWAFVRSSPHIYRVFSNSREQILPFVIAEDIGVVLMSDGLAALSSSRLILPQDPRSGDRDASIRGPPKAVVLDWIENEYLPKSEASYWVEPYLFANEKLEWLERYKRDETNRRNLQPPLDEMLPLWELHKDMKFMAELYVRETSDLFNQSIYGYFHFVAEPYKRPTGPLKEPVSNTLRTISSIEKQRILRAFYRFIIFGNLFAPSSQAVWTKEDISEYFLCRFSAWQIEEISCINDFITDTILLKWQELEDKEFNRRAADPKLWEMEATPDFSDWHMNRNFFSKSSKQLFFREQQAHLVSLPIRDLRTLFEAKSEMLEELVKKFTSEYQGARRPFLAEALNVLPESFPVNMGGEMRRSEAYEGSWDDHFPVFNWENPDDVMQGNAGWCWTNPGASWILRELYTECTINHSNRLLNSDGFRRLGYVFWDYAHWKVCDPYNPETFKNWILEKFPRPSFEDQSLSVEERIGQLARNQCSKVINFKDLEIQQ